MPEAPLLSPEDILALSAEAADRLLARLEETVPVHGPVADLALTGTPGAIVFGDSHGDWPTMVEVVRRFRASPGTALVGMGDYVDRTPADCPNGSVANALYLLQWAAREAPRVVLLRGNHETVKEYPVVPHSLRREVEALWGEDPSRYDRLVALLNRGPLVATSPSGVYLAHGGFPRSPRPTPWTRAFEAPDHWRVGEIVWADCAASHNRRGVAPAFKEEELLGFLAEAGLSMMIRGHDPDLTRRPVYGGRCLTLHTTRYYERYGGVLLARLPLTGRVSTAADIRIEDVRSRVDAVEPSAAA